MKTITIAGNVGKDAVVRQTQNGKSVTGWSVGVNDGWGDRKSTLWFDCSYWGERGSKVAGYLTKGAKVTVSGSLGTREHEGKTYLTIDVTEVTLQGGERRESQPQQSDGYGVGGRPSADLDDSIPFSPSVL